MSLLGIDVGTTGCKAVAYAVDGKRLSGGTASYAVDRAGGRAELSVREVENAVMAAVREAIAGSWGDPIAAVCVTSMGESFVLVDEDGPVYDRSILGHDPRGRDEMAGVIDAVGEQEFYRITGNLANENHSLAKLLWLAGHEKEALRSARRFLCWSEYIAFSMGAVPAIGYSHANRSLMFDMAERNWSVPVVKAAAVNPELLPMVLSEGSSIGMVSAAGEERYGLPRGALIILGGHDQVFNALGAGCVSSGSAVDGMGTFECITPVYSDPPSPEKLYCIGLNLEHHAVSGLFVSFIYNQSGSVAEWFVRNFVKEAKSVTEGFRLLEREMPEKPARPLFLPLLENSGSPYFIGEASGVYEGIKFDTDRGELFKATIEGITFYFLESLRKLEGLGIRLDELAVSGGASASDPWLQLKADIFGIPVVRLAVRDAGAMGAAMLAGIKTGVFANAAEAASLFVRRAERFEPSPVRSAFYLEKHALYLDMFASRSGRLHALSRFSGY